MTGGTLLCFTFHGLHWKMWKMNDLEVPPWIGTLSLWRGYPWWLEATRHQLRLEACWDLWIRVLKTRRPLNFQGFSRESACFHMFSNVFHQMAINIQKLSYEPVFGQRHFVKSCLNCRSRLWIPLCTTWPMHGLQGPSKSLLLQQSFCFPVGTSAKAGMGEKLGGAKSAFVTKCNKASSFSCWRKGCRFSFSSGSKHPESRFTAAVKMRIWPRRPRASGIRSSDQGRHGDGL